MTRAMTDVRDNVSPPCAAEESDADRHANADVGAALIVRADLLWLPKAGNTVEEYEDSWAISPEVSETAGRFACAVADGATETSFAGRWARLLADAYCAGGDTPDTLVAALPAAQATWQREVAAIPLPWYAEQKARQGAFAALVGLTFTADPDASGGRWTALAGGDSCAFQTRDGALEVAFPLASSEAFGNRPTLLSSDAASNAAALVALVTHAGDWLPGDRFYLLTDALACWSLARCEAGDIPWPVLDQLIDDGDPEAFVAWCAAERGARTLRNDDVTLLRVIV